MVVSVKTYALLKALAGGLAEGVIPTNRQIAQQLGVKEGTVRTYLNRLALRLGWSGRLRLAMAFTRDQFEVRQPKPPSPRQARMQIEDQKFERVGWDRFEGRA